MPAAQVAFVLATAVILVIPGPGVPVVIGRALAHGRRAALASVAGNELGGLVLVVAVAFGAGAVVASSHLLFVVATLAGAGHLVLLGVRALGRPPRRLAAVGGTGGLAMMAPAGSP